MNTGNLSVFKELKRKDRWVDPNEIYSDSWHDHKKRTYLQCWQLLRFTSSPNEWHDSKVMVFKTACFFRSLSSVKFTWNYHLKI